MFGGSESRFRFFGRSNSSEPLGAHIYSDEEKTRRIESVLEQEQNHRTQTYGITLNQIPAGDLGAVSRVLEVGLNNRLFLFRDLFADNLKVFGMTMDEEHFEMAKAASKQHGVWVDVRKKDLMDGFPGGWQNMDLALDIYSASHYADSKQTMRSLASTLRPGGYIALVQGGGMDEGIAEYIRKTDQFENGPVATPRFRYDLEKDSAKVFIMQGESRAAAYADIAKLMKEDGFDVRGSSSDDLANAFRELAALVGENVVSSYDLLVANKLNYLKSLGIVDVKKYHTRDGAGVIGRKK